MIYYWIQSQFKIQIFDFLTFVNSILLFWNFIKNNRFPNYAIIIWCWDLIAINFNTIVFIIKIASFSFFLFYFTFILMYNSIWSKWKTIASKLNWKLRSYCPASTHCLRNHDCLRPITFIQRHIKFWNQIIIFVVYLNFSFISQ